MSEQNNLGQFNEVEEVKNLLNIGNFKRLFRVNYQGQRLYVDPEPFSYYSGLTGAMSAARFNGDMGGRILKNWRDNFIDNYGKKAMNDYVSFTADFGSLVHTALVMIKNDGKVIWSEQREMAESYFEAEYLKKFAQVDGALIKQIAYEYQKHIASLLQFIHERVSEIHAIETPAIWNDLKIATPIDIVCDCRQTPKGDFAKTVINVKTSNQITDEHLEQVACELDMWNKTYGMPTSKVIKEKGKEDRVEWTPSPNKADYAAILRTKDWREKSGPSFDYKYMSEEESGDRSLDTKERLYLCLTSKNATYYPEPTSKVFVGETIPGEAPEVLITSLEQDWADLWIGMQERERIEGDE